MARRIKDVNKQMANNLGHIIQEMRANKAITQIELSQKANITRTFLSLIENGERFPSYDTLNKIAKLLDTNIYSIIMQAKIDKYDEGFEIVNQLTKLIDKKDKKKLEQLVEFVKSL